MMQQQEFIKRAKEIKTKLEEIKYTALTYECFFHDASRFGKFVKPAGELQSRIAGQLYEIKEVLDQFDLPYPPKVSEYSMNYYMEDFESYIRLDTNLLYELTREVPQELKKKYDLK